MVLQISRFVLHLIVCNPLSDSFLEGKGHVHELFEVYAFLLSLEIKQLKLWYPLKLVVEFLHGKYMLEYYRSQWITSTGTGEHL